MLSMDSMGHLHVGDSATRAIGGRTNRRLVAASMVAVLSVWACAFAPWPAAATTRSGPAIAWGWNAYGQLGDGGTKNADLPVAVALPAGITATAVAVSADFSMALTTTGRILAWSDGLGTLPVPVSLPSGTTVTAIAAGGRALALTSTGSVLAWSNGLSNAPVPVSMPPGTEVVGISAGYAHNLAVTSTGQALAWGYNSQGQLGNGTTTSSSAPVPVSLPPGSDVVAVSAGENHSLALTSNGRVLAWGGNGYGSLGDGVSTGSKVPVAVDVPSGTTVTAVSAGWNFSLVLTVDGRVLGFGLDSHGQLGDGTTTNSLVPVYASLPSGTTVTAINAQYAEGVALTSTGGLLTWGSGAYGALGNGNEHPSSVPVAVSLPPGSTVGSIASGFWGTFYGLAIEATRGVVGGYALSPSPIAHRGSLAAGAEVSVTFSPVDNLGAIRGATVYLSFRPAPGGGSARIGSIPLTSTPTPFAADGSGHIIVTYQVPSTLPSTGKDSIRAQNASVSPTVARTDAYNFAPS